MNPTSPLERDTFSFQSFYLFCESAFNRTSSELSSYFESAPVKQKFKQKLSEIFEQHESNPIEAWTRAKITSFKSDNSPISNELTELMNVISKSTNISIFKVYQYIDDLKRSNPAFNIELQKPGYLTQSQSFFETIVVENFHKEKMNYLKGMLSIVAIAVENPPDDRVRYISGYINDLILNHEYFSNMLSNCKTLHNEKASDYMKKNADLYVVGKLKEQYVILNIVFKLLANGKVLKQAENDFEGFFKLFLSQKFAGVMGVGSDDVFVNVNSSPFVKEMAEKTGYCQLFISLAFVFNNVTLNSGTVSPQYLKYLATIADKGVSLLTENEDLIFENTKVSFFQTTFISYLSVIVKLYSRIDNCSLIQIENSLARNSQDMAEYYAENTQSLLESLKVVDTLERNDYRKVLKQALEQIWLFCKLNEETALVMFRDDQTLQDTLLLLFKEVMKNEEVYVDFWNNDDSTKNIRDLVTSWFSGFPYQTSNFIRATEILLGKGIRNFADNLVDSLGALERITIEVSGKLPGVAYQVRKNNYTDMQDEVFRLQEPTKVHEEFELSKDTTYIIKGNNLYEFEVIANFWEFFMRNTFKHLSTLQKDPFLAPPLNFYDYLRLLCKFIICNPNTAVKIENFGMNEKSERSITQVLFILMSSLKILYENPNEMKTCLLIIQALKSLILSHESEYVKFFIHAHSIFVHETGEIVHPIAEIYRIFSIIERDVDIYKANEKYLLSIVQETVELLKLLVVDDDFWLRALKVNLSNDIPLLVDRSNERKIFETNIQEINALYQQSVYNSSWSTNAHAIHRMSVDIFNRSSVLHNTIVDTMWNNFILPLCTRFIKDDIDTTHENIRLKYKIYNSLFDLLNIVYSKFIYNRSERTVWLGDVKENLQNSLYKKFVDFIKRVPLKEMLSESFEVLLDSEVLQNKRFDRLRRKIGVENKHYVVNVVQKNSRNSLRSIKNFLCSALKLLNTSLKVVTSVINEPELGTSIDFVNDIFRSFCVRDTQLKYVFNNFSDHHEVSMIVSLISLLDLESSSSALESYAISYQLQHCSWNIVETLFNTVQDANKFIFIIDVDTLFAKGISNNISYRASQTISALVFGTLNSLLKLWKTQNRSSKPSLIDYIVGLYNELPVKSTMWHSFILHIHSSLHAKVEQTVDFLLECCESQFSLIEKIIKTEEVEVSTNSYNKFFDCLRAIIVNVKRDEENDIGDKDINYRIVSKTLILGIQLFQSNKLSKGLLARHWDILTDTIVNGVFDRIKKKNQSLQALDAAINQYADGDADAFTGLDSECHSVNINLIRAQCLSDQELLFDELMLKFVELFSSHFVQKVLRGASPLFDTNNKRDLVKRLRNDLNSLISCYISSEVISSDLTIKKMLYNVIPNTISDLNKVCSDHNNTFINANQKSFSRQTYYIDLNKDQTRDNWDNIFNSQFIYYIFQMIDMPQDLTERIYVNTFLYNSLIRLNMSKQRLQPKVVNMIKIINSVGVSGNLSGSSLVHIPFSDLSTYINNICHYLQTADSKKFENYNNLLIQELKASLPNYGGLNAHNTSRNVLNLNPLEKVAVLPFWNENNRFYSIIELYSEGTNVSTIDNLNQNAIEKLLDKVKDKLTYIIAIISDYNNVLRSDSDTNFTDLVSSPSNWETLFELLSSYITVYAHMIINMFTSITDESKKQLYQFKPILDLLTASLEIVTNDRNSQKKVVESAFRTIHLAIYSLKQSQQKIEGSTAVLLIDLTFRHLKSNTVEPEPLIKIIEWLYDMQSGLTDTAHISYFASRLTTKNISLSEYRAIMNLFISIASQSSDLAVIYNSKLISELSYIESIKNSPNYKIPQFYVDNVRDDCHVRFCYLLQLYTVLMNAFIDQPNFIKECFYFLTTYQPRFEMLLNLGAHMPDMSSSVHEISANVKTMAFLEEFHYALPIIATLTRESDFWYRESPTLYAKYLSYMINHSMRLFSHDPLISVSNVKNQDGGVVSDKFKPVDSFEKLLATIQVNEKGGSPNYRPLDSVNRVTLAKSSVSSELAQFNNFKNLIMYQSSYTNSLFSHRVEILSQTCLFQLLTAINNMLERCDYQLLLSKHPEIFNEDTIKRLANSLNGCQLYLAFSHQKLHHYGDNFKEGLLHLMLMHNTVEGYVSTQGLSNSFPLLSINEMVHIVRKTFEFAYYLQVLLLKIAAETDMKYKQYYTDGLINCKEKAKIVLAEFLRLVDKPAPIHSVSKESKRLLATASPFKSLQKYTPRNISTDLPVISEEKASTMLINKHSIETHARFLDSVQKLFQNK